MPVDILRQIIISAILPYLSKVLYLLILWLVKKLLRGLDWLSNFTTTQVDDELVALMERALEQQEDEPAPPPPNAS